MSSAEPSVRTACVYCLQNNHLAADQVLWRGRDFYLCAPKGQIVEGFLAIAPYACIGALSKLPDAAFDELASLQVRVRRFYASAYGTKEALFYEQGRGGGGASVDALDRFPLHAHLCSLPVSVALHALLDQRYLRLPIDGPAHLAQVADGKPYLYVEAEQARAVYVARQPEQTAEIECARLKPIIAELMGMARRGDWRAYPGEAELTATLHKWRQYC